MLVAKNITLENVKKSDYWNLIAILVWNHYSEERYQEESAIEITEDWYGKGNDCASYAQKWDVEGYYEDGYVRTLNAVVIKFTRSDYITYIHIHTDGNVHCFGLYTDKTKTKQPQYNGSQRNLDITNWLLKNNFIKLTN